MVTPTPGAEKKLTVKNKKHLVCIAALAPHTEGVPALEFLGEQGPHAVLPLRQVLPAEELRLRGLEQQLLLGIAHSA